ncbi:MAG TPA: amino acid adenylation domain-containing protein, partial [Methanocorpusculum sp.]|nr:amino acid adenylation domain-containing protein [Methanocorpusculum sp.]
VVDKCGLLLPPGAVGELWLSGPQVARGYLNRPEKTAEVFTKNTFSTHPAHSVVYHTGDIVRYLSDGNIQFIGRHDSQVKIRGFRIELTEVEEVISRFTGIKDAAVAAYDSPAGGKYLAAYVVSDKPVDIKALNAFIAAEKPPYMVPAVTIQLDVLPHNQNMKVNRKALPVPELTAADAVPPQNELQQKLYDIVANVLGHSGFGINTNFTDAGLTSISSVQLLLLLNREFNMTVKLAVILEHNTVEKLAEYLQNSEEDNEGIPYEIQETYPLTQAQKEIAATCMRNPDAAIYNLPGLYKLERNTDIEKLKSAIITAVNAHPYIKATLIADESGELRAQRNDDDTVHLSVITCDTLPDLQTFVRPFNLIESPLYRIEIYSSNDGLYLFADFHHIICDGTSLMILLSDISKAYLGEDIETESYTGFDAALTEEKARTGTKYQQDKEYYTNLLEECDTDSTLYPDSVSEEENLGITEHICTADFKDVKKFCSKHSISENAFFNAVFSLVLSKYTDSTDVLYATVYNGRNDSRLSRTFTMQVKTFPVFSQIQKNESFVQFARDVQTHLLNGMAHDLYSFAEIINSCRLNVENYFVYQADSFNPTEFAGEKITQIPLHPNAARFALRISLSVVDNKLNLLGEFRTNTYSEFLIQSFLTSFDTAVKECLTVNLLSEISLITPAAAHLLNEFNATDAAYNSAETIIDGFHESVLKHQDKTAVVFKDTRLTYKELDEITDNLAEYLCKNGVGAETVVGILIPRNEYMPICALGVLKAGGAYLPLDPSYPKDRLNFMLKDSDAVLLIADKSLDGLIDEFSGIRLFTDEIKSLPNCSSLLPKPNAKDLFAVLYTSGSTGIPKGVILTHQNIAAFCSAWIARSHELDETARVGAYASFGFDVAIEDIFPTLLCGAELHIIPEELRLDLIGLRTYFNTHGITHCHMTTQIGRQFALLGGFTSLKEQMVGGEKLVPLIPPSYAFYETYGPTECTVLVTTFKLETRHTNNSIGKPLNNVRCYVVDKCGLLLPPGAVGELWLSGPQVARGYLNRPEKTAEVFTKNTFSTHPAHSVVYHTGDIVRYLSDGNIQFIGRHDSQVKIRGFRIELTEV